MSAQIEIIIPRRGINDEGKGKKYALGRLIGATKADYVWLQDDDIVPPAASEAEVLQALGDADMLILPLRMQTEDGGTPTLLERLQMAEYAAIQQLTLSMAQRGHAVLCSGANLIVRRTAWLAVKDELHPEIPSGDDMFLLEALKRNGYKIGTLPTDCPKGVAERLTAIVHPVQTWRTFFRQRMRWAGKAPAYTDSDILLCGAIVVAANILQFLCPPFVVLKFPFDYALIRRREPKTSFLTALLLALVYPYYMLICLVGGIIRTHCNTKKNWK